MSPQLWCHSCMCTKKSIRYSIKSIRVCIYTSHALYSVLTISDPCNGGDIRLWGGQEEYEGNIEICTDHGVWSEICDSSWGDTDAIVACRQLNYTNSSKEANALL